MNNNNLYIANLYDDFMPRSRKGGELLGFVNKLIADESMRKMLCNPDSYIYNNLGTGGTLVFKLPGPYIQILNFFNKNLKQKSSFVKVGDFLSFCCVLGQKILKNREENKTDEVSNKQLKDIIDEIVCEYKSKSIKLSEILSCSDFMDVSRMLAKLVKDENSKRRKKLKELLRACQYMEYDDVKRTIKSFRLSDEDKKIVFTKVLPKCKFKIYSEFDSTWDMFKDSYIDFNTLVTKFWNKDNFEQQKNALDQKNVFQKFANEYKKCFKHSQLSDESSIKKCANDMIDELAKKGAISKGDTQNLRNCINDASNVGLLDIIAQFFSNLFSKGKTAFQSVSKTKQDRVISNLKPLSGMLKQATLFSKGKTAFQFVSKTKQDRVISNLKPLSGMLKQATEQHKNNDKQM